MNQNFIATKDFDQLEMSFTNGNKLCLRLNRGVRFFGFKQGDLLELSYMERTMGADDGGKVNKDITVYEAVNTQFFPVTKLREAIPAFFERKNSPRPYENTRLFKSYLLEECLQADEIFKLQEG